MLINKILVFWWISLLSILIIENMVVPSPAYLFINSGSTAFMLAIVCSIIWMWIWYWVHWFLSKDKDEYWDNF